MKFLQKLLRSKKVIVLLIIALVAIAVFVACTGNAMITGG